MDERGTTAVDLYVVIVGSVILVGLIFLPAGQLRVGESTRVLRLVDLIGVGAILVATIVLLAIAITIEMWTRRGPSTIFVWGYAAIGSLTVIWIFAAEGLQALIPSGILPATVRRFTVTMGARPAPWLAVVTCVVIVLAARGRLRPLLARLTPRIGETASGHQIRLVAGLFTLLGAGLVGAGRSAPLVTVDAGGQLVRVSAWAVPFVGPMSMLMFFVLVVVAALVLFDVRPVVPALIGSGTAWIVASGSAVAVATSGLVVKGPAQGWVNSFAQRQSGADIVVVAGGTGGVMAVWGALIFAAAVTASLAQGGQR